MDLAVRACRLDNEVAGSVPVAPSSTRHPLSISTLLVVVSVSLASIAAPVAVAPGVASDVALDVLPSIANHVVLSCNVVSVNALVNVAPVPASC